jgi:hypothetical protein
MLYVHTVVENPEKGGSLKKGLWLFKRGILEESSLKLISIPKFQSEILI